MLETLAFIGAGRMARAMVGGLLRDQQTVPNKVRCLGANDGTGEQLSAEFGIVHCPDMEALLDGAQIVVLACKPQQLGAVDRRAREATRGTLLLSILAGTPITRLRATFPHAAAIVRAMPNTPGLIGAGITAYASEQALGDCHSAAVRAILGALGSVEPVAESALNAVTGLSGSGPAYVFEFVAALRDGGIAAGLAPDLAYRLALQTVRGAAELLVAVPETPETHRDWVCSPGGTTLAGLSVMEAGQFRSVVGATVQRATHRAVELAES
jgi:pyrroline-5-carboxylate reductase